MPQKALFSRRYVLLGLALAPGLRPSPAAGGPAAPLAGPWRVHGAGWRSDESAWAAFLVRYRRMDGDGIARLAYGRVTAADKAALAAYIGSRARVPVARMTRPQQFAFWVNLYNAATVQLILQNYPLSSITRLKSGLLSFGPWGRKLVTVTGVRLSLDDIEHGILRALWQDPRIHFVVNCASLGCPDIPPEPLYAETLEIQLDAARSAYLAHPRGVRWSPDGLHVSSIFHWYADDFGGPDGVVRYIKANGPAAIAARITPGTTIAGHSYDWSLNDAR